MIDPFGASVADIRSLVQAVAVFLFKVLAGLIAGRTGSAFDTAEDDLAAGICFPTVIPMHTEVLGIIKSTLVIPVRETVSLDFFRDSGWILAQEPCNVFKGSPLVQFIFDINTIFKGKMFLVTGDIFTHSVPPSTAVRRRYKDNISI